MKGRVLVAGALTLLSASATLPAGAAPEPSRATGILYTDKNSMLHLVNPDGTGDRIFEQFTRAYDAQWSPDGSSILVAGVRNGEGALYTMRSNGTAIRRLTWGSARVGMGDYSPDGTRVAFRSCGSAGKCTIKEVPARGGRPKVVSKAPNGAPGWCYVPTYEGRVRWSPTGDLLSVGLGCDFDSGALTTAIVSVATGRVTTAIDGGSAAWSPDGRELASEVWSRGFDGAPPVIVRWRPSGAELGQVSPGPDWDQEWRSPVWSPNGKELAYVQGPEYPGAQRNRIIITDKQGKNLRTLVRSSRDPEDPIAPLDWR